jgi:hypothetical protein
MTALSDSAERGAARKAREMITLSDSADREAGRKARFRPQIARFSQRHNLHRVYRELLPQPRLRTSRVKRRY